MHNKKDEKKMPGGLFSVVNEHLIAITAIIIGMIAIAAVLFYKTHSDNNKEKTRFGSATLDTLKKDATNYWKAPDINTILDVKKREQVAYGKELIAHTSKYFGPNGSILPMSNGLNCQNCHLQAGTAVFGNNYGSVASTYPKFRPRSGSIENVYKRVNDCFERSLHGKVLDSTSSEMQAIVAYINFIGSNVAKGKKAEGSGFKDLVYLDRAADTIKGHAVYINVCERCHQLNGQGLFNPDKTEYTYPALWGKNSFTDAAGMFRITNLAKFVKYNMPQGTTFEKPQLTDEEAWDVAAFVSTQTRPHINEPKDWPDKAQKPVDQPNGPYADNFPEQQHKYGPFKPIAEAKASKQKVLTTTNR